MAFTTEQTVSALGQVPFCCSLFALFVIIVCALKTDDSDCDNNDYNKNDNNIMSTEKQRIVKKKQVRKNILSGTLCQQRKKDGR